MRAAMADRIAREIDARELTCADVQRILGDKSDGGVRTELALIKRRRVDHDDGTVALSFERVLKFYDVFALGWDEAVAQPPARLYRAAA